MSTARHRRSPSPDLWVCQLGTIRYQEAVAIQKHVRERRLAGELPDTLLLLEHPPVYTRGRRSGDGELPLGESFYSEQGIEVIDTDRGGRITYHGPGQLVGYPIMRIEDVHSYLRRMEGAILAALMAEGVHARSRHKEGIDYTGVWVQERKIASIGVHVSRGITTHGFAVNVENDLEPFSWVIACGLPGTRMTSLAEELGLDERPGDGDLSGFRERMAESFADAFGHRTRLISPLELGLEHSLAAAPPEAIAR